MCGLLTRMRGERHGAGRDLAHRRRRIKRAVGYMTQRFSLYEDLTIEENLDFVAGLYGLARRADVDETLEAWASPPHASWRARSRAAGNSASRSPPASCTARSSCCWTSRRPGVDPKARREFWDEIHRAAAAGHDGAGLDPLHGRGRALPPINYIAYGRLVASGTVAEVIARCRA
jgi:ABC-2 type transport system ATP-binding protein